MSVRVRLASLALLSLLYFGLRLPFVDRPLMGEEGVFADLLVEHDRSDRQGLMGRIGGEEIRVPLQHPIGLYASLAAWGALVEAPWRRLLGEDWHPTWALRLSIACFQFAVWALLALWLAPGLARRPWAVALFLLLISTPLALGASLYLQTDPSNGTLLAGLCGLALSAAFQRPARLWARWVLPAAALLLGAASKQEWSFGVAGGLGLAWAWGRFNREGGPFENRLLSSALAGLLAGNLLSWAAQPRDYADGFKLMVGLGESHNALVGSKLTWLAGIYYRAHFLLALGALWLALAWRWRSAQGAERAGLRWGLALSLGLGVPFLLMAWGRDYRYFVPAYMVAAACLIHHAVRSAPDPGRGGRWAIAVLALHSLWFWQDAWRGGYCITERPYVVYADYLAEQGHRERVARELGCVAALPTGLYWHRDDIDWLGDSMGPESIKGIAMGRGRTACRP